MSILETYYTYAKLAQAAYIDLSNASWQDPVAIVNEGIIQGRMPEHLGLDLFTGPDAWTLLSPYYKTSNLTGHSDPASGFAGMLLSNPTYGKVLAIAVTEPTNNVQVYF